MCKIPTNFLSQPTHHPLPIPDAREINKKRVARLKFWELSGRYHCSALGTCLTLNELRQLGIKARIKDVKTWDDYQLHISFLAVLDEKSYVSTMVNKFLDKKYKINILYMSKAKNEKERMDVWNKAVASGDIAGAFWALLTHPQSTDENLFQVYGEVHMLSHLSGSSSRIDMRDFHRLEERTNGLEKQIDINELVFKKKLTKKENQLIQLRLSVGELKNENQGLKLAHSELKKTGNNPLLRESNDLTAPIRKDLKLSKRNVEHLQKLNSRTERKLTQEQEKNTLLQVQLNVLLNEKTSIEKNLASLLSQDNDGVDNCESCISPDTDLCGRCVLYIGGRNKQYSHFRKLVEQQNGAFLHHDGGREDSVQKLASIVSKADVVVCPLDCVSHNAMNTVKRHCQNNTKQLVFIPHASLSAFSKGLGEVL